MLPDVVAVANVGPDTLLASASGPTTACVPPATSLAPSATPCTDARVSVAGRQVPGTPSNTIAPAPLRVNGSDIGNTTAGAHVSAHALRRAGADQLLCAAVGSAAGPGVAPGAAEAALGGAALGEAALGETAVPALASRHATPTVQATAPTRLRTSSRGLT